MEELKQNVDKWFTDRGLDKGDPNAQMLKLMEEVGETSSAMLRNDKKKIIDGIGDIFVSLDGLALKLNLTLEQCVGKAYDEIKDRRGVVVNGTYVKLEDMFEDIAVDNKTQNSHITYYFDKEPVYFIQKSQNGDIIQEYAI